MTATFIRPDDSRWGTALGRLKHDVYHLPGYALLCARYEHAEPLAFYAEIDDCVCLVPLLVKRLGVTFDVDPSWCDMTSPYGYACPLYSHPDNPDEVLAFLGTLRDEAFKAKACSVFLRSNPLLPAQYTQLPPLTAWVPLGETVVINLHDSEEKIWSNIRKGHKQDIQSLRKLNASIVMDDWNLYGEFVRIYHETMGRVHANSYYMFSDDYFSDLRTSLPGNLHMCCVLLPDGRVAAAGLFTVEDGICQYHLSGTNSGCGNLPATKYMLHHMSLWARQRGCSVLHLGGGVGAQHDSLFKFKEGFSHELRPFGTCRIVPDESRYVIVAGGASHSLDTIGSLRADFFPLYRRDTVAEAPIRAANSLDDNSKPAT
ncbi:MAG: GNAT family N-acetyltransferase [Terracidiphilus sp.]|nr:GNAT family N-acetyltransferase [Terracidiphilus sp.]